MGAVEVEELPGREAPPIHAYAVRLALTFANWVNRRVECFEFVDAETVRRRMSIDFTLPVEPDLKMGEIVAVPVMLLDKGVVRGLDVTDADGRALNVFERDASRAIALGGLMEVLGKLGDVAPAAQLEATLKAILRGEPKEMRAEAKRALEEDGEIGSVLSQADDDEAAEALAALVGELVEGFMLLVALPYQPESPGLVKVSYDARIGGVGKRDGGGRGAMGGGLLVNRLLSSVGLMGRAEYFDALPLRLGRSYHVEVLPAPGTYSGEANLVIKSPDPEAEDRVGRPEDSELRDTNHSRPHLWIGGAGRGTDRGERGRLTVVLYARRDGLIFPLFFSAAVIAGVLAFVPKQDGHLDGITLGALLLAPVALAAYYARSDENGYLTMAMRSVRGLATLPVIAGVTVIALLGLGYIQPHAAEGQAALCSSPTAIEIARWAGRVALVCADVLGMALLAPTVWNAARGVLDNRIRRAREAGDTDVKTGDLVLAPPLILVAFGACLAAALFILLPI
ncbi:MAG: hypothetical protein ACTHKT_10455 [Solirubrobacterales bacterium]